MFVAVGNPALPMSADVPGVLGRAHVCGTPILVTKRHNKSEVRSPPRTSGVSRCRRTRQASTQHMLESQELRWAARCAPKISGTPSPLSNCQDSNEAQNKFRANDNVIGGRSSDPPDLGPSKLADAGFSTTPSVALLGQAYRSHPERTRRIEIPQNQLRRLARCRLHRFPAEAAQGTGSSDREKATRGAESDENRCKPKSATRRN